jgi:hypothetical protein
MLAVDISFLAVPGVDAANIYSQSGATLAIYTSVITSTSALIISVLLAGQIRRHEVETVEGGVCLWFPSPETLLKEFRQAPYMARMTGSVFGTEGLAVMFSFPYALLMWG